jgi:hypothetical protein
MSFKEELENKYRASLNAKVQAEVDPLFEKVKTDCLKAAENARASLDFVLGEVDSTIISLVGRSLEMKITRELGLVAKFVVDSDCRDTTYYIRITGWTR